MRNLVLALCLCLSACAGGPVLDVWVSGLSDAVRSLEVRATFAGRLALGPLLVRRDLSHFQLELPLGSEGELALEVSGNDEGECALVRGAVNQRVGVAAPSLRLMLSAVEAPTCRVVLSQEGYGDARVVSIPPGIDCGEGPRPDEACAARFPLGQEVELRVQAISAQLEGWSGACQGRARCLLRVRAEEQHVTLKRIEPRLCTRDRFCWESPLTGGQTLKAFFGRSATDQWAVGEDGLALRFDGRSWLPMITGTSRALSGVWAAAADDGWIVGDASTLLHFDGRAFTKVTLPETQTLWNMRVTGSGPRDVWVQGALTDERGALLSTLWHYDGATWRAQPPARPVYLQALWSSGPSDVWAVGDFGVILHFDGARWSEPPSPTSQHLNRLWGSGPNDVWAVGAQSTIVHFDGSRWSLVDGGILGSVVAVAGRGPNDVWFVTATPERPLLRWDGARITPQQPLPKEVGAATALWADEGGLWVSGSAVQLERWDGAQWRNNGEGQPILTTWGSGPEDVYAGGPGVLRHWDGLRWSNRTPPLLAARTIFGLWGSGPSDLWIATEDDFLHFDGARWSTAQKDADLFQPGPFTRLWGSGAQDVWAVGLGKTLARWDGQRWRRWAQDSERLLTSVWGSSADDVWAAGYFSDVLHFDGRAWTKVAVPMSSNFMDLWGHSADDVWIAGDQQAVLRWDGARWNPVPIEFAGPTPPGQLIITSLWGSAADDVWGAAISELVHWDGQRLRAQPIERPFLSLLWGSGPGDLWVYGTAGQILRYRP